MLMLDNVVFHTVIFRMPDFLESLRKPHLLNAGCLALFATPVIVVVAFEIIVLIV
jgi:hypothetical protein